GPWPTPVRARPVQWRPGSIRVQPSTLEEKDWPSSLRIDPNFQDNSTMEWLLEDDADVVVTALMVRELGPCADPEVYGPLAARVREDGRLGARAAAGGPPPPAPPPPLPRLAPRPPLKTQALGIL
ncbi:unnamed protein product, partial [Prorocentrum cordatum]